MTSLYYAPQTPSPRAKSRSRMSHLLRPSGSENTTTPHRNNKDDDDDVTPESPMLLNALKLAARSGSGGSGSSSSSDSIDENSQEGFSPLPMSPPPNHYKPNNNRNNNTTTSSSSSSTISNSSSSNEHSIASSYANSIEAMAATVEAAAINRQRPPKRSPKKSPKKKNKGSGGGVQYQGTRKQLFSSSNNNMMKKKRVPVPKLTAGHLVAIIILVPFVMMEAFLSVLVFTYNYNGISVSVVGGGGGGLVANTAVDVVSSTADDDAFDVGVVHLNIEDVAHQEDEEEVVIVDEEGEESDEQNDLLPPPQTTTEDAEVGSDGVADHLQTETENDAELENTDVDENDVDVKSNIEAMQSMLKEALQKLNDTGSDRQHGKKAVETLCLTVWSRGVEALSSLPNSENENNDDDDSEDNNDTWNALAMDAQRCLGGAELVYLSRDVNIDSVRKAKVIFENLSDVDPDNANVRAGLGTSLLILGVMKEDVSFLKLAMFHLKAATSLCQKKELVEEEDEPQAIFQSDTSAMSAAILHNLALANIALGDDVSPVSLLLRSEAIRRQVEDYNRRPANLFWNCHHDALLTIEQQAVLMGVKSTMRQKKKKTKSKIPFLSDRFGKKASA